MFRLSCESRLVKTCTANIEDLALATLPSRYLCQTLWRTDEDADVVSFLIDA
jgi:hypothetical protein